MIFQLLTAIERKLKQEQRPFFQDLLDTFNRLLVQTKDTPNKLYSLYAPEVKCIAKGKAHKRYEFGCKVSLVVTHKQGLVLSSQALPENPYDGQTLKSALSHAEFMSGVKIERSFVDQGYKKHGIEDSQVVMARQKGLSRSLKNALKRRNAIEPHIGHMKSEGKLDRNYLKGKLGDALNALLVGVGHNLRLILSYLRFLFALILGFFKADQNSNSLTNSYSFI